jgi:hypothetical protein
MELAHQSFAHFTGAKSKPDKSLYAGKRAAFM